MTDKVFKDAFGTPVNKGDIVAFRQAHGRYAASLEVCEVVGFTPKMLRLRRLKVRTTEPVTDSRGGFYDCNGYSDLCVRIDVKAYLGLAS